MEEKILTTKQHAGHMMTTITMVMVMVVVAALQAIVAEHWSLLAHESGKLRERTLGATKRR